MVGGGGAWHIQEERSDPHQPPWKVSSHPLETGANLKICILLTSVENPIFRQTLTDIDQTVRGGGCSI